MELKRSEDGSNKLRRTPLPDSPGQNRNSNQRPPPQLQRASSSLTMVSPLAQVPALALTPAQAQAQAQAQVQTQASAPATNPGPPQTQTQVQASTTNTTAPAHISRPMPPRSPYTDPSELAIFFDLATAQRAGLTPITPFKDNIQYNELNGLPPGEKRRVPWEPLHKEWLMDLVALAILQLNRRLTVGDFKAITEALHRRFAGTTINGAVYWYRGFNSVHSYVVKSATYLAFEDALL